MGKLHKKGLRTALAELSLEELKGLDRYLHSLIEQKEPEVKKKARREVIETRRKGKRTYQLVKIYCGKKCSGCPHGPYWYAYWKEGGRSRSEYVGKTLDKRKG